MNWPIPVAVACIAALAAYVRWVPLGRSRTSRAIPSARVLRYRLRRLSRHVRVEPDGKPLSNEEMHALIRAERGYRDDAGTLAVAWRERAAEERARGGAR